MYYYDVVMCMSHDDHMLVYLILAIMTVLQLPPSESFRSRVSLLFRYGTWTDFDYSSTQYTHMVMYTRIHTCMYMYIHVHCTCRLYVHVYKPIIINVVNIHLHVHVHCTCTCIRSIIHTYPILCQCIDTVSQG